MYLQIILKIQLIYVNIKKTNKSRIWRSSPLWKAMLRSRMYPYVVVDNFCHAHITKFCWKLVALQLNSLNLLENRYHEHEILSGCQGAAFYKKWLRFYIDVGIFLLGPA